jgi:hypothetical protein
MQKKKKRAFLLMHFYFTIPPPQKKQKCFNFVYNKIFIKHSLVHLHVNIQSKMIYQSNLFFPLTETEKSAICLFHCEKMKVIFFFLKIKKAI